MGVPITGIDPGSPAARAGVRPGEILEAIDGHPVRDVLDYRFYGAEPRVVLTLSDGAGARREVPVRNPDYRPLGMEFETYLMDRQKRCHNKCVFCFIDQLPKGMRESLYFKDDDVRMSFLMGSYVTLTNLTEEDFDRLKTMRLSPLHVSVHATDAAVRETLCHNRQAGECFRRMHELAAAGIDMACQIVVCPGLNDGAVLEQTLRDLMLLWPRVTSAALVPVGLTDHREGLYPLRPVTREDARAVIALAERFAAENLRARGSRAIYCSDEFYILAGLPIPQDEDYEDYPQLENGVGMVRLLCDEFRTALAGLAPGTEAAGRFTLATGVAAAPFLRELLDEAGKICHNMEGQVIAVENRFFGSQITVAGLVTGRDLIDRLRGERLGQRLLIPRVMLRYEGDRFLDDVTVQEAEEALGVPLVPVPNDGEALLNAMLGR